MTSPPVPEPAALQPAASQTADPTGRNAADTAEPAAPAAIPAAATALSAERPTRVRWSSVLIFMAIAYGLFALCAAPFWILDGGIAHPLYSVVIGAGMFAPTIASVVVAKLVDKRSWRDAVGLRFRGRWKRIGLWIPLAVLVVLAINIATAVIMVLRGVPGDLTGRTWAGLLSEQMGEAGAPMSTPVAVLLVLAVSLVGLVISVVPALGEEIGWRGWLWKELKPLGLVGALVLGGAIWSLWHLPVTLIGHNYTGEPRLAAVGMFIPVCIAMNFLFGAITERSGGNPIPAAFAHSTLNSSLGLVIGIVATSETADALNWYLDTPLGLTGIALLLIAAYLIWPREARASFGPRASRAAAAGSSADAGIRRAG